MILKSRQSRYKVPLRKIRCLLKAILKAIQIPDLDLDVTFVDDLAIRKLNQKFRKKNKPTDVLSFPLYEAGEARRGGVFLGDIVLSVPTVVRQAREHGQTLIEELSFLLIHGVLHLLGYDHEQGRLQALQMQRLENKILRHL